MANEENHDDKASWTIKSMPVESRKLAVAAAARAGESMATWLDRAVRTQVKIEAGQEREQPPQPGQAGKRATGSTIPILSGAELEGLASLIGQTLALAEQAGEPVPKARAKETLALVAAQVRAARGLPPPKPRKPPERKPRLNGPTIEQETPPE